MSGHAVHQLLFPQSGLPMRRESPSSLPVRGSILLRLLTNPWRIVALVLLVVFAVEAAVMLLLPVLLPDELPESETALIDAALLTVICAPLLWAIIISPLRRIALEAQALSSTIVENAGDGIVTVDAAGRVLSWNSAARSLFGYEPEEVVGRSVKELLPEIRLASTDVGEVVSTSGRRRDGGSFPASASVRRIGSEEQSPVVLVVRDLTEARRAEAARTAAARQQEALRAQQMATLAQLATGVAHEIRNPLTAIKMLVQSTQSDEEITRLPTEDVRIVEDQIRRMEQSVNALLDFARPAPAERAPLSIRELIQDVIRLLDGQAAKQSVHVRFDESVGDLLLNADRDQLQQLMLNLGLNALNVMPQGGALTFTAEYSTAGMVCVCVRDTGPSVPSDSMEDIFQPFFTTRKQGIGLGLNICRRIAEAHGGTLTAGNDPAGGAIFRLCLPSAVATNRHTEGIA